MQITIETCLADVEIWRARHDQATENDTFSEDYGDCITFGIRIFDEFLSVFVPQNDDDVEVYYGCLFSWYRLASAIQQTANQYDQDAPMDVRSELDARIDQVRKSVAIMKKLPKI